MSSRISQVQLALLITLFALTITAASDALSQPGSPWNRRARAIAATPAADSSGSFDLSVVWSVTLDGPQSTPLDLSTEIWLLVNGTVVATAGEIVSTDPGGGDCIDGGSCFGSCGTGIAGAVSTTLICQPDGPCGAVCDCYCGFLPFASPFDPQPLEPGDEIMVILMPAPGALPDPDTTDDQLQLTFEGGSVFWNRTVESVELTPSSAGPGLFNVEASGNVQFDGLAPFAGTSGQVDLSLEASLLVGGTVVSTELVLFAPQVAAVSCYSGNCGSICGQIGVADLACLATWNLFTPCACGGMWFQAWPDVPMSPGDEIMVLLRPAPGALPELPGLPDDDDRVEICCPTAGIGEPATVGAAGWRLHQNQPNPFNPSTTIAFSVAGPGRLTLEVFDLAGRHVRTLVDGAPYEAGEWSITWDGLADAGERVASGAYFYRLTANGRSETRKMMILK